MRVKGGWIQGVGSCSLGKCLFETFWRHVVMTEQDSVIDWMWVEQGGGVKDDLDRALEGRWYNCLEQRTLEKRLGGR